MLRLLWMKGKEPVVASTCMREELGRASVVTRRSLPTVWSGWQEVQAAEAGVDK